MKRVTKKIAAGAAIAGAVGYVAGILTAPKSGKETRKDIQNAALRAKIRGERQLKALNSELTTLIIKGKRQSSALQDKAKTNFAAVLAQAQTAKEWARNVLTALHEGGAEDKELTKAIKDVNKAIAHLKVYVDAKSRTVSQAVKKPTTKPKSRQRASTPKPVSRKTTPRTK